MADDLAARISDGAVAVLDLVPGEQRFHELSRFVLRGGASRFAAAVLEDEPVRYVLPVGIPGRKLDYGTLLIQRSRCALVWRTDPARPYRARIVELGPDTTVSQSPVTIRGEVWGRFDVQHGEGPVMTFLVPPVSATALPRMLHRVLVEQPRSQLAFVEAPPLPTAVTEGVTEPVPSFVDPDAPTEGLDAAAIRSAASAEPTEPTQPTEPAPAAEPTEVLAAPESGDAAPAVPDAEPTQATEPTGPAEERFRSASDEFGIPEPDEFGLPKPDGTPPEGPTIEEPEPAVPEPEPAVEEPYEDLYRTTERVSPPPPPEQEPPSAPRAAAATGAGTSGSGAGASGAATAVYRPVGRSALPTPVPPSATPVPPPATGAGATAGSAAGRPGPEFAASAGAAPSASALVGPANAVREDAAADGVGGRLSDGLSGYLIGLVVTLVIGGGFLLAKYLGWLG